MQAESESADSFIPFPENSIQNERHLVDDGAMLGFGESDANE